MTVSDLTLNSFTALTLPQPEREISGVYIGDLLSWVMGRAQSDDAWLTIMSNVNILAVASLADVSCIILTESVQIDAEILKTAEQKGINILSTDKNSYQAAVEISKIL